MRNSSIGSKEKSGWSFGVGGSTTAKGHVANETNPLIQRGSAAASTSYIQSRLGNPDSHYRGGEIRERRPSRSQSPAIETIMTSGGLHSTIDEINNNGNTHNNANNDAAETSYRRIQDDGSRSGNLSVGDNSYQNSTTSRSLHSLRRSYLVEKSTQAETIGSGVDHPPLLEIPEEVYGVRKAALQMLKPLTRTWVSLSCAIATSFWFFRRSHQHAFPKLTVHVCLRLLTHPCSQHVCMFFLLTTNVATNPLNLTWAIYLSMVAFYMTLGCS
jgi:hypothetical protein